MDFISSTTLLAAEPVSGSLQNWEWSTPRSAIGWMLVLLLVVLYLTWTVWLYWRDSQSFHPLWRVWLMLLRLGALAGLLVIAFNPQLKTTKTAYHASKVGILIDTSLSMRFPAGDPDDSTANESISRLEASRKLLFDEGLIAKLREQHEVSIFTFDSRLKGPIHVYPSQHPLALEYRRAIDQSEGEEPAKTQSLQDELQKSAYSQQNISEETDSSTSSESQTWDDLFPASGTETRLAESVNSALTQLGGHLSGLIVTSDGASNAGLQASYANAAASQVDARLVAVGIGSTRQPVNLTVASVQAPSLVRISDQVGEVNDQYDVVALIQGSGLSGKTADVDLLMKPKDDPEAKPTLIESRQITFQAEEERFELTFNREPTEEGREEYLVQARLTEDLGEINTDDNSARRTVNVTRKRMEVLVVASGPMRDYRFLRSMLSRRSGIEMDIWLQTVDPALAGSVDQDARELLTEFPTSAQDLNRYDVIIAFDPNWRELNTEQVTFLSEWVATHAGGMIYVAGDVFTGELSTLAQSDDPEQVNAYKPVLDMLPVHLALGGFDIVSTVSSDQGWQIDFTKDGEGAGFLQLDDDPGASQLAWKEFEGIYRAYPTAGPKPAATVYAYFSDPRFGTQYGQPILLASQFYGAGRVIYLGSAELWRIRALSDDFFNRFWVRAIREVAQGRMKQGNQRLLLMPERKTYYLGQTVRIRGRVFDRQLKPLEAPDVTMRLYEPDGREVIPARKLIRDPNRVGEYVGDFRVTRQGTYRLELLDPEENEAVQSTSIEMEEIEVTVPKLESENTQQNVKYLRDLVDDTNGGYVTLESALATIPDLLPNVGEAFQIDVSSRPLWDKAWVMYLLIGLLCLEWLTRKLLKLA
ncbi:hypothetical protein OAK47_01110 [Planctomycetaceae bacterium]|jgi:hypothetical protein|nr:hypothetical protein [Planctomycetaceae bacterium]MDG2389829.1 hypothetical protein [Planctomycetaceae bacterium]